MEEVKRFTMPVKGARCYAAVVRVRDGKLAVMVQDMDLLSQWPLRTEIDGRIVYLYDRPTRIAGYLDHLVSRAFGYKKQLEEAEAVTS